MYIYVYIYVYINLLSWLRYIGLCTLGLCIHRAWRPHSPEPYEYMRVRSLFHELIPRVAAHLFQILSVAPFPDPRTLIDAHKALNFGHSGQSDLEDHLSLIGKSYPSPRAFASPEGWRQRRSLPRLQPQTCGFNRYSITHAL